MIDAKHFGVPQRRRRIFALADFGDWTDRQPILFEREGVCRDIKKSKEAREGFANHAGALTANGGRLNRPAGDANELDFCIPASFDKQRQGEYGESGYASTLSARDYKDATDLVCIPINDKATRHGGKTGTGSGNGLGVGKSGESSPTLTTADRHAIAFTQNDAGRDSASNIAPTLRSGGDGGVPRTAVAYDMKQHHNPQETEDIGLTTENCSKIRAIRR